MPQRSRRSEDICRFNVITNHVGYLTNGAKRFVVESNIDSLEPEFWVRDTEHFGDDYRIFEGKLKKFKGDFGIYHVGDFSELRIPGRYVIGVRSDTPKDSYHSEIFAIEDDVYRPVVDSGIDCFATQRCGPSTSGYHTPCHLDDGVRADNGQFMDVVGGWHDASDLLKWSGATIFGMFGLLNSAELSRDPQTMARIFEEVRWGNLYFLKLQAPEGCFYSHGIGGDPPEEGNHFTDNIRGTPDDRSIVTAQGGPAHDHTFIAAQAHLVEIYQNWDAAYTKQCLEAARKCYHWVSRQKPMNYQDYGTGAYAGLKLYQMTGEQEHLDYAVRMADGFVGLQHIQTAPGELRGYFYADESQSVGVAGIYGEPLALIGFCKFVEEMKGKLDISRWQEALRLHCDEYLMPMSELNAFGIVPYQVRLPESLIAGSREFREVRYRYFMSHLNGRWWVGNNAHLAGTGIALCHAARILDQPRYRDLAQRMLDWILGLNPFDMCQMNGIGHRNPPEYVYTGFLPRTPKVTGSVICGICGDAQDRPDLQAGSYHNAEIWTPMLAQTIWLSAELTHGV